MKALVTGGAGFIGSNLVDLLLGHGHDVTVFDSLVSGHRVNLKRSPGARLLIGDIRDLSLLRSAVRGVDVIFHLAASVGNTRSIDHPHVDASTNVLGTLNVLEAAREFGVRKFVLSSSAGVLGELKTPPIREDHPAEPDTPYGATKLCAEKLSLAYGKLYGFEVVCLRYFNVFGRNQRYDAYGNVIPIFAHRILRGEPLRIYGDGEQTRDFVNVVDVARANMLAGQSQGVSGVFNVGSGTSISINHLVSLMRDASGLDTQVIHGPARLGDVRHSLADLTAIRRDLGFQPTVSFAPALAEYIEWAKVEMQQ